MDNASSAPVASEQTTPFSILVVDDSKDTRTLLSLALERCGYRVTLAESGMEALEILQQQPQDLVLTDLWMPNMDGAELVRLIRLNPATATLPIVLMTASFRPQLRETLAADAFMTKPLELESLVKLLEQLRRTPAGVRACNDSHHAIDLAM